MYAYRAYDLSIRSDFSIPELLPDQQPDDPPDVVIRVGVTPRELGNPTGRGVLYQASANQFLVQMDDVARYLVKNGNEIVVEPAPGSLESDVRVFLLGSSIGALLHQRGLLVLHASGIYGEQGAVLFTGSSGSGKSTLLGEMMRRGYRMMVDDVCGIALSPAGAPMVLPAYPRTRLWKDAATKLGASVDGVPRTRPSLEKFELQVIDRYWNESAPVRQIFFLIGNNRDEFVAQTMSSIEAFRVILQNTYRKHFLAGLEMRGPHFALASAVARQARLTRITRPRYPFRLTELADLIEHELTRG